MRCVIYEEDVIYARSIAEDRIQSGGTLGRAWRKAENRGCGAAQEKWRACG